MDPFRKAGGAPPPPPEPALEPEPPEAPGRPLLRSYRRTMLGGAVGVWLGASLVLVPLSVYLWVGAIWNMEPGTVALAVLGELAHAGLYVLAPRLAWGAACDRARTAAWGADLGGWVACAGAPRWPLWTLPISGAISLALVSGGWGLLLRLVYVMAWLAWCDKVSRDVAILRWANNGERSRVLELETLDRPRRVELEGVDSYSGEIRLLDQGQQVTWRAITPIDTLARDVKKSALQGL